MTPRIEIELTSSSDDGTWTWRAAGARQPRGTLTDSILYKGAKVGDIVRAEADFFMDGISITAVQSPRTRQAPDGRLEVIGPPTAASHQPPVNMPRQPASPSSTSRRRMVRKGDGRESETDSAKPSGGARRRREDGSHERSGRRVVTAGSEGQTEPASRRSQPKPARARERPARLVPGTKHRDALLLSLQADQRTIAEQLVHGGIPAVRRALDQRNETARQAGVPVVDPSGIVSVAEELLPRVNAAMWLDKAEAASKRMNDVPLRDLRSIVAGAGALTLDEPSRMLAASLRDALAAQVAASRDRWLGSIERALSSGNVLDALNRSARPPDPGARFPADLAVRLAEHASETLDPGLAPELWHELLSAALHCPARRMIKPKGLPTEPTPELLTAARQASAQIPHLATLLGMSMPPPPPPKARVISDRGHSSRAEQPG